MRNFIFIVFGLLLFLSGLFVTCRKGGDITPKSSVATIDSFSFNLNGQEIKGVINSSNNSITVTVPAGTNVSLLTPTIGLSPKASVNPNSGVAQDFSNEIRYTVTAEDGTQKVYTVRVQKEVPKSTSNEITGFVVNTSTQTINGVIDSINNSIMLTVPDHTDLSALAPVITISPKASVNPASGIAQNFSNAVKYTVTAENGNQRVYTVNVRKEAIKSAGDEITGFIINVGGQAINGRIDRANNKITVTVPANSIITALTPAITISPKASVSPASGTTQNFSTAIKYTVTAEDGTQRVYTVNVQKETPKSTANEITGFVVNTNGQSINGVINKTNNSITLTAPANTNINALAPVITISPKASVSPTSGATQNFSTAVKYTVTAEDGTQRVYTVNVQKANATSSNGNEITSFSIAIAGQQVVGNIDNANSKITMTVPSCTDLAHLSPTIVISDKASISPASGTEQSFSSAVEYTVKAENGTTKKYSVELTKEKDEDTTPRITSFKIVYKNKEYVGDIEEDDKIFLYGLPSDIDLSNLSPIVTTTPGADYSPKGAIDESQGNMVASPNPYTVTKDGYSRTYKINVGKVLGTADLAARYQSASNFSGTVATTLAWVVYADGLGDFNTLKTANPSQNVYYEILFSKTPDFSHIDNYVVADALHPGGLGIDVDSDATYYMLVNFYVGDGANRKIVGKSYKFSGDSRQYLDLQVSKFTNKKLTTTVHVPGTGTAPFIVLYLGDNESNLTIRVPQSSLLDSYHGEEKTFDVSNLNFEAGKQYYIQAQAVFPLLGTLNVSPIIPIKPCAE